MNILYPAAIALLPALVGPQPNTRDQLTLPICGSDAVVTIDLDRDDPDPDRSPACHGEACHAGCNRKKFDPAQ